MVNNHHFKEDFYQKLPNKPYCSLGKGGRTFIRSKAHAINYPLIQINSAHLIHYLIFDIDAPDAYLHFLDANLPTPNWIAKNKNNGHCHVCYSLKTPVCKTANARLKPLRYLAAIEFSYAKKLGADLRYTGVLTKNPLDHDWQVSILNDYKYELSELADYVELEIKPKEKIEVSGFGRNCMIFDTVRYWSYRAISKRLIAGMDNWYHEVLEQALIANQAFLEPLPYSEVKATAKSIARWVWRNHNSGEFQELFSLKQSKRAKLGVAKGNASKGGKARSAKYSDIRQEVQKLHLMGKKVTQIAKELGISRPSVYTYLKDDKKKN
jgi:hypothetical protein